MPTAWGGCPIVDNAPIFVASGSAAEFIDGHGHRFIDLAGGIGVLIVGRRGRNVVDAIQPPGEQHDVFPDLATTAESLTGAVDHGDLVVYAAALAVLNELTETDLTHRAMEQGRLVWGYLRPLEDAFNIVLQVRAHGPKVNLELVVDERTKEPDRAAAEAVVQRCRANGVLILNGGPHGNVIRLMAPPVISDDDLHEGLEILADALGWANQGMPAT